MGKNRKTNNSSSERKLVFLAAGGKRVYDDSYSHDFYRSLQWHVGEWVDFQKGKTPDENLTKEELDYVRSHMENNENVLTRVEPRTRTFSIYKDNKFVRELEVGDEFSFNGELKAFSRDINGTNRYIEENFTGKDLIIYRTPPNTKGFNVTEWDNNYEWEQESWVDSHNWKVENITDVSDDYPYNYRVRIVDIAPTE